MIPASSFSLMKNLSISTCFVLSCGTGLFAIQIADLLSHQTFRWPFLSIFSSFRRFLTHNMSPNPCDIALYSASAVDLDTTGCFLLLHDTRLPPTNTQYPDVDLRSSRQLAQSASLYPSTTRCPFPSNRSPFPGVPFKYLRILWTASTCPLLGSCMYLLTILTAYAISGLV